MAAQLTAAQRDDHPKSIDSEILVIGRDDFRLRCSTTDIYEGSEKLWRLIEFDKVNQRSCLRLDLPWRAVSLLVDSLKPHAVLDEYWQAACLDELIDVIELYRCYDIKGWNVLSLEEAIIRRLQLGPDIDERLSRFDLVDARYALKLRSIAHHAGMQRLVQHIDREAPAEAGRGEYDEGHPRKWRKVSAKYVAVLLQVAQEANFTLTVSALLDTRVPHRLFAFLALLLASLSCAVAVPSALD